MPKTKGSIPDRWLKYTKIGQPIEGTRFIAFKTPLARTSNSPLVKDTDRFSPDDLLELRPDLGLVIDLTNTHKYYSPDLIRARGVQYRKVMCMGHKVPRKAVVKEFHNAVAEFLTKDTRARVLIGVHCTHGVNRTGYLLCHYMIRRMGVSPRDAIAAFAAARGHGIERMEYVRTLWSLPHAGGHRPRVPEYSVSSRAAPNTVVHNQPTNRTSMGYTRVFNNPMYTVLNSIGSYVPFSNTSIYESVYTIPHLNYPLPRSNTPNPGLSLLLPSSSTLSAPVLGPAKVLIAAPAKAPVPTKIPVPSSAKVPVHAHPPAKARAKTHGSTAPDLARRPPRKKRNKKTKRQNKRRREVRRQRLAAAAAAGGVAGASMTAAAPSDLGTGCAIGVQTHLA